MCSFAAEGGAETCEACPANSAASDDRTRCNCAAGYVPVADAAAAAGFRCEACAAGSYNDVAGAEQCSACPRLARAVHAPAVASCVCRITAPCVYCVLCA